MSSIPREQVEDVHALSPVQQGMFFHSLLEPELAPYVEQGLWRLHGAVVPELFERAWNQLAARHTSLRSVFRQARRQPVQIVLKSRSIQMSFHDWTAQTPEEQRRALRELAHAEHTPFHLADGPLMRLALVRLGADEWRLIWTYHHIILDGLTAAMLLESLCAVYDALASGVPVPVDEAPPFSRFIVWLTRQDQSEAMQFWTKQIEGVDSPTPLPYDRRPTSVAGRSHRARHIWVSRDTSRALEALARRRRVTVSTLMHAAWAVLLSRYSGEPDVVFGLTVAGRPADVPGVERIAGPFINTLPARFSFTGDPRLGDLLQALRQQVVSLDQYSFVSLADIQGRTPVRAPAALFESAINVHPPVDWNRFRSTSFELGVAEDEGPPIARTNFDLMVDVALLESVGITISYVEEVFDEATIVAMLASMRALLDDVALRDGDVRISELNMLPSAERTRVLEDFNRTSPASAFDSGAVARIEAQAARAPAADAVVAGETRLSYEALNARANQIAWWLRDAGVQREDRVGVCGERGAGWLCFVLGILKAGAAFVPLDPLQPDVRLASMLSTARVRVLACGPESAARALLFAPALAAPGPNRARVVCWDAAPDDVAIEDAQAWAGLRPENPPRVTGPRDLACVFFTSGSTGVPKGVMVEHAGLLNHHAAKIAVLGIDASSVVAQNASMGFDISVWQMLAALEVGGCVAIYDDETAFDQSRLVAGMIRDRVTILETVPSLLDGLIDAAGGGLPSLRVLVSNAEFLPVPLCRRWLERFPHIPLVNTYGPTECSDDTAHYWQREAPTEETLRIPVGRTIPGARIYVVDRHGQPVPAGAPGEIAMGGVAVGRGYLDDPVKTALAFVPDPHSPEPGARMYSSGDIARWTQDGVLEWLRRDGDQVKVRGHRIELGEIQAALLRHHGIRQAVAVVRQTADGEPQIVAYWVGDEGVDPAALRTALAAALPRYMLPSAIMRLDGFPLTSNGKLNRRALPAPPTMDPLDEAEAVPAGPLETAVAGIWAEVLGVGRVTAKDNFFELGGQSLKTLQVRSRLAQRFGVEIPLRTIFRNQTVREQARLLAEALGSSAGAVAAIPRLPDAESYALSHAQRRLWFVHQLDPADTSYNLLAPVVLEGALDRAAFDRAWSELVARHASLRTTFAVVAGEPVQQIHHTATCELSPLDLSALADGERLLRIERTLAETRSTPFTLETPPVRALLVTMAPERHLFTLVLHHLVSDGWSGDVLVRDLLELYRAARTGTAPRLPPMPIRYVDYAAWQNARRVAGAFADEEQYWIARLSGELPVLDLPAPRQKQASDAGIHTLTFAIDADTAGSVRHVTDDRDVTPFMLRLALVKAWLARLTGSDDLLIGSPVAGRNKPELESLVGFFVNLLPLRTSFAGDPSWTEIVDRVKRTCLEAYARQEYPFDELVRRLNPERRANRVPIFDVMFMSGSRGTSKTVDGLTVGAAPGARDRAPMVWPGATLPVPLLITCVEEPDRQLSWTLTFDAERIDRETARGLTAQLEAAIRDAARRPHARLSALDLLPPAEREWLVHAVNPTSGPCPATTSLHRLFETAVAARPHAPALRSGEREWTYDALNREANRLAWHLARHGVEPGTIVATFLDRSPEFVVAVLAILKTGAAYLPLDPGDPAERIRVMLEDVGAPLLVTTAALMTRIPDETAACALVLDRDQTALAAESSDNLPIDGNGESLCHVMYTSGSTGRPKGVMIPHRSVTHVGRNTNWMTLTPTDRVAQMAKCSFDASTWEVWGTILNGACLVVIPPDTVLSPVALTAAFARERITAAAVTPALLNQIARETPGCFLALRYLFSGGDVMNPRTARLVLENGAPEQLINVYGPTENSSLTTFHVVDMASTEWTTIPVGRPIINTRVYIVDSAFQPVGVGIPGELWAGGAGLAHGYWRHPAATAERFVPDPFGNTPGARVYRTGDLARWRADGSIEFIGRVDYQVKIRGHRVEVGEIEAVLRQHPDVADAVVVVREDRADVKQLAAYVVAVPDASIATDVLRRHVSARLPGYMVPTWIVPLASLPLTATRKVDRRALPMPDEGRGASGVGFLAPTNALETEIAAVWQRILAVEQVGVDDNFFDLGGDSIQCIMAVAHLGERGIRTTPKTFYANPTVAALAAAVECAGPAAACTSEDEPIAGPVPLVPVQRFVLEQAFEDLHHWNVGALVRSERLDAHAVERALQAILDHHDALRMRFWHGSDGWQQHQTSAHEAVAFEIIDIGHDLERLTAECARIQASLDLTRGPLFRAALFRLGDGTDRLLVITHHLVNDIVSSKVLGEDLTRGYEQALGGEPIRLPAKTTSYARWAQILEARAPERLEELEYWRATVEPGWPALPLDFDLGPNSFESADRVRLEIDADATRALLTGARQAFRMDMPDVLLGAAGRAFGEWTGQPVCGILIEGHGRQDLFDGVDLSRTMGWFTTFYPLRLDTGQGMDRHEHLRRTREALRAVPHRGLGYGLLRYTLRRSELGGRPHPDVSFNYQGQFGTSTSESRFTMARESPGPFVNVRGPRLALLNVECAVFAGRLVVVLVYSRNKHRLETIQAVSDRLGATLREIAEHALARGQVAAGV